MTREEHKERHILLHRELDELIADFISCTKQSLNNYTIKDFLTWSYEQTKNPTELEG
jgi:hypothetical protein